MKEKYIFSSISNIVSYFIFLISNYIMALKFAPSILGIWIFINSVNNLGFMFVSIGFDKIHFQYSSKKDEQMYFGTFFFIKNVLLLFNVIITIIIISILNLWNNVLSLLVLLLLIDKIIFQFGNIFILHFKTNLKIFKAEIPYSFSFISKSIMKIYIAFNISTLLEPLLDICIFFIIFDIIYLGIILFFSKNEFNLTKPKKELILSYLKDAKFLIILSVVTTIAANLGNIILDYSLGHESFSYFSLINFYLIPSLLMIASSIFNVYLAHFSHSFEKNDISSIKSNLNLIEKYSSIFFLILLLIVYINGEYLFTILLPEYIVSLPILYIMIFIPFIYSTSKIYSGLLISGKKQNIYALIEILTYSIVILVMFFSIFLNYIIHGKAYLDMVSYAISQTLPWILWSILLRYYCKKYFKVTYKKTIIWHFLIALITLILMFMIKNYILQIILKNRLIINLLSFTFTISLFFVFLWIFKQINKSDLKFFYQLLNIKDYLKSMKDEFSKKQ